MHSVYIEFHNIILPLSKYINVQCAQSYIIWSLLQSKTSQNYYEATTRMPKLLLDKYSITDQVWSNFTQLNEQTSRI